MHIMWHNLISLSFISQRSTHREDMRIIGFMFRFTHHAEQEMQKKHAYVGNVWANLWISGRPQIWKILVKNGRPALRVFVIQQKTQKGLLTLQERLLSGCTCDRVRRV